MNTVLDQPLSISSRRLELDITDLLDVVCGDLRGTYIISRQRVLHNGIELTPPEFERMGGRHAAKKWKQSIKVVSRNGVVGMCLGDWLVENGYEVRHGGPPDDRQVELVVTARPQMMLMDGGVGPFQQQHMYPSGGPPPFLMQPNSAPIGPVYPSHGQVLGPPSSSAPSHGPMLIGPGGHAGPDGGSMFGPPQPMQPMGLGGNYFMGPSISQPNSGPSVMMSGGAQGGPQPGGMLGPSQGGMVFMDHAPRNVYSHSQPQLIGQGGSGMMQTAQPMMMGPAGRASTGGNGNPMSGPITLGGLSDPAPPAATQGGQGGQSIYITEPPAITFVDGKVMLRATTPQGVQIYMPLPNSEPPGGALSMTTPVPSSAPASGLPDEM